MRLTKFLILGLLVAFLNSAAFAEGPNIQEAKTQRLKMIDEHIKALTDEKTCINNAADIDSLKACHKGTMMSREEMRQHGMEQRAKRSEKRMKKLEEDKKRLEGGESDGD